MSPRPSKTAMLVAGLKARGYSEAKPRDGRRCFAIDPRHARRLCGHALDPINRLWITEGLAIRHGWAWESGRPIPRVTIRTTMEEGRQALAAAAKAEARRPIITITADDL